MNLADHAEAILTVTGLLTMGAIVMFVSPESMLKVVFGVSTPDVGTTFLGRHWSLLVFLIGGLLVFAGRHPQIRFPVMMAATIEKLAGSCLVLATPLRRNRLALGIVAADSTMAILYILMLF